MYDDVNILSTFISFSIMLKIVHKVYNLIRMDNLTLINIGCAREVFHYDVIFLR